MDENRLERLVHELSTSGHEVLVLAAHIEHATFLQKGTRIGSDFFKKHQQILREFLSFCQGASLPNQVTTNRENNNVEEAASVATTKDTKSEDHIHHECTDFSDRGQTFQPCSDKPPDTNMDSGVNTEVESCLVAVKIPYTETASNQSEKLKSNTEVWHANDIHVEDDKGKSSKRKISTLPVSPARRSEKSSNNFKLQDNASIPSDKTTVKVKRNKNRKGSVNVSHESNYENVKDKNAPKKRRKTQKRVNPKYKISGPLLSAVIEEEKIKTYGQCIETKDTKFVDFLRYCVNEDKSAFIMVDEGTLETQNNSLKPSLSGKMMNGVNISGFAGKVLILYENWDLSMELTLKEKECVFCNMKLETSNEIKSHLLTHKQTFELNLETCKKCKVTLPSGYVRCHPCVKGAHSIPKMISCWYKDIRDEAAFMEIRLAQKGGNSDVFLCAICSESFQNVALFREHFVQKHIRTYKCRCEEYLNNLKEIKNHVEAIHCVSNDDENRCKTCDIDFTSEDDLNSHVREFHCKGTVFKCEKCSSWFSCRYLLSEHFCSEQMGYYRCNIEGCNERFKKYKQIQEHKQNAHGSAGNMCSYCGKMYLVGGHLTVHLEWVHGIGKPINCKVCGLECRGPNVLRSHMLKHTTEKRYSCEICGHSFRRCSGLSKHKKSAHSAEKVPKKKRSCEVCNASFYNASSLQQHIINTNHTTATQELKLEVVKTCKFCGKQYATNDHLHRHEKVHLKKADYSCEVCGKSFIDRSNWRQHKWTHTGKPKCDKCGIQFRSLCKLKDHMTEEHGTQPASLNGNLERPAVGDDPTTTNLDAYQMDNPSQYVNMTVTQASGHQQLINSLDPSKLDQPGSSTSQIQDSHLYGSFQQRCTDAGISSVNMDSNYFSQALDMQYMDGMQDSVASSNGEPAHQNLQVLGIDRMQNYFCESNFQT